MRKAPRALAQEMVKDNIALVYGGGNVGLMGIIASEVIRLGGEATGVIPKALLDKGTRPQRSDPPAHRQGYARTQGAYGGTVGRLHRHAGRHGYAGRIVRSADLGPARLPLQARLPCLNVDGFYNNLIAFIEHLVSQRFLTAGTIAADDA